MPEEERPALWPMLTTLHANQIVMISMLNQLLAKEAKMAIDLTAMTAEVANNTTVEGSVLSLLSQLTTMIQNIPPSTDPVTQAALNALVGTLSSNDAALAAAVTANTPPPVAPAS